jgi:hypothetical protein
MIPNQIAHSPAVMPKADISRVTSGPPFDAMIAGKVTGSVRISMPIASMNMPRIDVDQQDREQDQVRRHLEPAMKPAKVSGSWAKPRKRTKISTPQIIAKIMAVSLAASIRAVLS